MPRVERLPPPPAEPPRSPAVVVHGEVETRIAGIAGGPSLGARVHSPAAAVRAVVICHPHPLYGGSMHSPVPLSIAKALSDRVQARVAWVRFDFRGVGTSEGAYDDGRGEVDDAKAVIEHMRRTAPGVPISVCGHSFGSWVGLRSAAVEGGVDRVLLISPSARFFDFRRDAPRFAGQKTIFFGDADEYSDLGEVRQLARDLGAHLRIFEGFDHHFMKSRRVVAEAALPVVAPEGLEP